MATNLGSAYVTFGVDNSGLRTGINEAVSLLQQFQAQTRKPLVVTDFSEFAASVDKEEARIRSRIASIKALNQQAGGSPAAQAGDIQRLQDYIKLQAERALRERDFYRALAINQAQARTLQPGSFDQQQNLIQRARILGGIGAAGTRSTAEENRAANEAVRQLAESEKLALRAALAQGKYAEALTIVESSYKRSAQGVDDYNRALVLVLKIQELETQASEKTAKALDKQREAARQAFLKQQNTERKSDTLDVKVLLSTGDTDAAVAALKAQLAGLTQGTFAYKEKEVELNKALTQQAREEAAVTALLTQKEQVALKAALAAKNYAEANDIVAQALARSAKTQVETNQAAIITEQIDKKEIANKKALEAQVNQTARAKEASQKIDVKLNVSAGNIISAYVTLKKELQALTVGTDAYKAKQIQLIEVEKLLANQQKQISGPGGAGGTGSGGGGGFLGGAKDALEGIIGPLTIATATYQVFNIATREVSQGFELVATLDQQRRSIISLTNSLSRGNEILQDSIKFGQEFGITQKEMGEAAQDAGLILRTSTVDTEKALEVLGRLQSRVPTKSFNDAVRSIQELQTGQLQSIERVFNIPQRMAQQMYEQIKTGRDAIEVLDEVLTRLGATTELLRQRNVGSVKALNDLKLANEALAKQIGTSVEGPYTLFLQFLTNVEKGATGILRAFQVLTNVSGKDIAAGIVAANKELTANPNSTGLQRLIDLLVAGYIGVQTATDAAADRIDNVGKVTANTLQSMREGLVRLDPELGKMSGLWAQAAQTVRVTGQTAQQATDALQKQADAVNAVTNQYTSGAISVNKYIQALENIGQQGAGDPLGIIKALDQTKTAQDRINILTGAITALQQLSGQGLDLKGEQQVEQELIGIAEEIQRLTALTPLTLTIQMQTDQVNTITQAFDAIRGRTEQLSKSLRELNQTHDDALSKFAKQMTDINAQLAAEQNISVGGDQSALLASTDANIKAIRRRVEDERLADKRSLIDYNESIDKINQSFTDTVNKSNSSYKKQVDKDNKSFAEQQRKTQRDFDRAEKEAAEDLGRDLIRIERETRESIQHIQGEFDVHRARDLEDFNLKRLRLLAEGKVKEAQLLTQEFNLDQKRKQEDLARQRNDARDKGSEATEDRRTQDQIDRDKRKQHFDDQIADEKEAHKNQLEEAAAAHEEELKENERAHEKQLQEADAARKKQQQRQDEDRRIAQTRRVQDLQDQQQKLSEDIAETNRKYKQSYTDLLDDYDQFLADQNNKIDAANKATVRQLELMRQGMDPEVAKAIALLDGAQTEMTNIMEKIKLESGIFGNQAALNFLLSWANTLRDQLATGDTQVPGAGIGLLPNPSHTQGRVPGDPLLTQGGINAVIPGATEGSTFSADRPGTTGSHFGIDIQAPEGTYILSPVAGKVVAIGTGTGSKAFEGNFIIIEDMFGRQWYLGHIAEVPPGIKVGSIVKKGQAVAIVGSANHVHVQVKPNHGKGAPIDPTPILNQIAAGDSPPTGDSGTGVHSNSVGSPQRRGVMFSVGQDDGDSYANGFASGINRHIQSIDPLRIGGQGVFNAGRAQGKIAPASGEGAVGTPRQVQVTLAVPPIMMDGQVVGQLIAPTILKHVEDDIALSIVVTDRSVHIPLKQPNFREP